MITSDEIYKLQDELMSAIIARDKQRVASLEARLDELEATRSRNEMRIWCQFLFFDLFTSLSAIIARDKQRAVPHYP